MDKEIEEIIRKNLPAQVGDVLKKELEELETLRGLIKSKEEMIKDIARDRDMYRSDVMKVEKQLEEGHEAIQKAEEILKREEQLKSDERILSYQLESSRARVADMKELVGLAFRNPVLKKTALLSGFEGEQWCNPDTGFWGEKPRQEIGTEETTE